MTAVGPTPTAPAAMGAPGRRPLVLHATTVPITLRAFLLPHLAWAREQGFAVEVVSSPGPYLDEVARAAGVPAHALPMARRISPCRDLAALWALWRLMRRCRPDIVHAHTPKAGLLAMLAACLARVPVRIYHIHGLPALSARGWQRLVLAATERLACRAAHRVLCVSHSVREVVVAGGLCPPAKITVPLAGSISGVDTGRFRPETDGADRRRIRAQAGIPQEAVVIGYVGRIVRDKGLCELAEAWQALRQEYTGLHLLLVGPPEAEDPLPEAVLQTLQEDPRVHLWGEDFDTPPLYAAMDLVVLPTYREGFPVVPLEAAAMALPVVITDVPGARDSVVPGVTGTLVPAHHAPALASALRAYLGAPDLRAAHGAAGRERVLKDFQPVPLLQATVAEYRQLLSRHAPWRRGTAPPPGEK